MTSYKHEKENIGYPITSIETERDTSDVPEEFEETDKPVRQSPGYSRVFEFDAILNSFIRKNSQEEPSVSKNKTLDNTVEGINIDKEIDEATKDIDWKNLDKDEIKKYVKKSIEQSRTIIPSMMPNLSDLIKNLIKYYLKSKVPDINTDKTVQDAINQYSDYLSKNKSEEKKEKNSILLQIKEYWKKFKEEWPIDRTDLIQYLSNDLKEAITILNDEKVNDLQEVQRVYNTILSISPIHLDDMHVFLLSKNILHYVSSDTVIQIGTIPVKIQGQTKNYPVLMNEEGVVYIPISKKPKEKVERGRYKIEKGKIVFICDLNEFKSYSVLIEGKHWVRTPFDLIVSKMKAITRSGYELRNKQGQKETKELSGRFYEVRNENTDLFSHSYFYVDDIDLLPATIGTFANLSEIPWISRDFSNSPETPISNSPVEEPGNPYYQSTHNSVVDYLAMPNVGDTLGERRIDRGYSGDAEYQDKDYIKLYKEKKKEELKNKVKKYPYYSFFLERDSI
jgi:hypothetical protein